MGDYIVAVDIGTTHCRSVVYRLDGCVMARSEESYRTDHSIPGAAVQDADEVCSAAHRTVREAIEASGLPKSCITAVVLCSVFHSLIGVDGGDAPVTPLITWADSRSIEYSEALARVVDGPLIRARTGCSIHPMYFPARLAWLREEMPDVWARVRRFVSIKEYVLRRWTGEYVVDLSVASGTGLLNNETMEWDDDLLSLLGVTRGMFSALVEPTHVISSIRPEIRRELGLAESAVIVTGAADGALAHLATVGAGKEGVSLTVGTGAAIRRATDRPAVSRHGETWCYYLADGCWLHGVLVQDAGGAFNWLVSEFYSGEIAADTARGLNPYHTVNEIMRETPPGANGLYFLPFLGGERSPNLNPRLRGAMFGMTFSTRRSDLVRALVEGISYRLRSAYECLVEDGENMRIVVTGGFTSSAEWVQTTSDFFGRKMLGSSQPDGSAWGAALIGMVATGLISDIADVDRHIRLSDVYLPRKDYYEKYQEMLPVYDSLYNSLVQTQNMI